MKVKELRELLSQFNQSAEIVFSYEANDYWRTTVAEPVGNVAVGRVEYSAYHKKLEVRDIEDEEDGELVVVISK